jgi:hypothetical protein
MSTYPAIYRIVYRRGMVADPSVWQGLETTVLEKADLSDEIMAAIVGNDLLAAGGVYGIPDVGEPVQIDSLQISHEQGTTEITVYNRAIMLFHTDDEVYRRIHRVCCIIERQTGRWPLKQGRGHEDLPGSVVQPRPEVFRDRQQRPIEPPEPAEAAPAQQSQETVYQLKVVLLETEPLVWRRFVIPSGATLHRLHLILQEVMGWTNSHLYRFQIGEREYAEPDPDNEFYELPFRNSKRAKLGRLVTKRGSTFLYEYDFGDSWIHELVVEDILKCEPGKHYPTCLTGERACPPEDCGGTYGYAELLEIISDPEHEEYLNTMTWLGGDFAPDLFDIEPVNQKLHSMRLR